MIFESIRRIFAPNQKSANQKSAAKPAQQAVFAQYRHGDVMLQRIEQLPAGAKRKLPHATLAHGEVTGHSHAIQQKNAVALYDYGDYYCLDVHEESASLVHEEHATIELPKGLYRVWRQREYTPQEVRIVQD